MTRTVLALTAALLASAASASTLIDHANGIQVDASGHVQHFTGLLIDDDGKVVRLLHPGEPLPKATTAIDARGQTVMPGFIDAHGHVLGLGFEALQLNLTGTSSIEDLKQRLRDYAAAHPEVRWIIGTGWNQELWPVKNFPTSADLDSVVSDRPVVLERVDGHAIVANSAAMKAAGVTAATQAPPGGRIENGLFVDAARGLIENSIPAPTAGEMDAALDKAQQILLGFGVTGVGAMSVSSDEWATFRRAGDAGKLQVRLMAYGLNGPLPEVPQPTGWLYGDHLRMAGAKFFADGALGSRGAWL
jgi:predicted amidohydrolase YtcJ